MALFFEQKIKKLSKQNVCAKDNNDLINIIALQFTRQIDELKQEIRLTKYTLDDTDSRIFRCNNTMKELVKFDGSLLLEETKYEF